jgi:hypothetical protein
MKNKAGLTSYTRRRVLLDSICGDDLLDLDFNRKAGLASNVQVLKNFWSVAKFVWSLVTQS